jgi:hypothetical protein
MEDFVGLFDRKETDSTLGLLVKSLVNMEKYFRKKNVIYNFLQIIASKETYSQTNQGTE